MKNAGELIRLILRRERIVLPLWGLVFAALPVGVAGGFDVLYPTAAQIRQAAQLMARNPAFVALLGEVYAPTLGGLTAWRAIAPLGMGVGIVSVLAVIRHTRTEEETGRRELLASAVLGRDAPLISALVVVGTTDVLIGLLGAVGLVAYGMEPVGSLAFGAAIAATGLMFATTAAVAAQVAERSATANGLAVTAVGTSFVLRMVGDAGGGTGVEVLSWMSPIGLAQRVRPFADERWGPLAAMVSMAVLMAAVAALISRRRDVGAGLIRPRPGPGEGSPLLAGPLALAWRIQGEVAVSWLVGFASVGTMIGAMAESLFDLMMSTPALAALLSRLGGVEAIADGFFAAVLSLFGVVAAAHGVQAALWLRTEELEGRAEEVLATRVSRLRWMASHAGVALAVPVLDLLAGGVAAGLAYGVAVDDLTQTVRLGAAALVAVPAAWLMTGAGLALFGLAPRRTRLAWSLVGIAGLVTALGRAVGLDQWVLDLSPFTHTPPLPGGDLTFAPLIWMAGAAAVLVGAGHWSFSRRDLEGA